MSDVAVVVPTFRRPQGLKRLLESLARLETRAQVEVVVADNDAPAHEGRAVCAALAASYRWPLTAITVAERGIAQARNALIDDVLRHSSARFVAMLDDDEWVEPGWLDALLRMQAETGADAVRGTVLRAFERDPVPWLAQGQGLAPLHAPSGPVDMIDGAGNVLVARAALVDLPAPHFDPAFALTGGEDRDFFTRLKQRGARFARAEDAVCTEFVPASRATFGWALRRAYRIGNSDMRVFLKYAPAPAARLRELAKIAGAVVLFPLLQAFASLHPGRRADPLFTLCRAAGKIAAVCGCYYNEYASVHGR